MNKILLNIGDEVELWSWTKRSITALNLKTYEVYITSPVSYPQWFHKMSIKKLNGKEVYAQDLVM